MQLHDPNDAFTVLSSGNSASTSEIRGYFGKVSHGTLSKFACFRNFPAIVA